MQSQTNFAEVWADIEDRLVPLLQLKPHERAIYSHLLRLTHFVGRRGVRISFPVLARGACMCESAARANLLILVRKGCLRAGSKGRGPRWIEVRLPAEVLARPLPQPCLPRAEAPPRHNRRLRRAILRRQQSRCFYCFDALRRGDIEFDHVVPIARGGTRTPDNIVAACFHCNRRKGVSRAEDFLRALFRRRHLTKSQLQERLDALRRLQAQSVAAASAD
jgi:hypothetical protein